MPSNQNINVKIPDDVLKGSYANNMLVSHSKEEFIIDFINVSMFPPPGQGIATAKIITSPGHMKRIVSALTENLKKYEDQFGKIEQAQAPGSSEMGFRT
ncbi:MAG: DUF3467 domain-containing protein [Candidatus Doudnabacteria bacterium]|nr:DUF3467 domain-containing protein [Candidatus Doudnabacteria bacterium]